MGAIPLCCWSARATPVATKDLQGRHSMPKYNRDQARRYARWYALCVCHDGAVAFTKTKGNVETTYFKHYPPLTSLVHMPYGPDEHQNDCTHFISCCIGDHGGFQMGKGNGIAGGVPIKSHDAIAHAYGIMGAPRFVKYVLDRGYAKLVGTERMPRAEAEKHIKSLDMGDIIGYAESPTGGYLHLVLHLYDGHIACHTSARIDRPWTDIGYNYNTLLQIVY